MYKRQLYQCPLMLHTNGLDDVVVEKLKLDVPPADLIEWKGCLLYTSRCV